MKSQRLSQSSPGGDGACASTRSGERGAYALFIKLDDVKYGLFMRLGTNRMSAVAELSATPPMGDSRVLLGRKRSHITNELAQNCKCVQAARRPPL
jgi:hypothetical protein